MMKSLKDFKLKDDPFQYLTAMPGRRDLAEIRWAGLPDIHSKIVSIYNNLYHNKPRQIILNWGPYGGGKTFAAYHFIENANSDNLQPHQVYVRSPKMGKNASAEFYKGILDYISYRKIKKQVRYMFDALGEEDFFEFLYSRIRNEEIVEAIIMVGKGDDEIEKLMKRYVYSELTKSELKQVGLSRNIEWGTDTIQFLSGIVHCFIGDQVNYKGRFVLWIDEMEDMIYYSQKEYKLFSQVLRDLFDSLNQYFTAFLNFTLAESEESTIEQLLGGAVWSRISSRIRFKELTKEDALLYCYDAIRYQHLDDSVEDYYPFTEDVLAYIFDLIPDSQLTPREINRYCGEVLNYALKIDADEITKELVGNYFNQLSEDY